MPLYGKNVINAKNEATNAPQDLEAVIVTMCVRGKPPRSPAKNEARLRLLRRALRELAKRADWLPIDAVILPAGYFRIRRYTGHLTPTKRQRHLAREPVVKAAIAALSVLERQSPGTRLVFGADSIQRRKHVDQLCLVTTADRLIAVARKIFPTTRDIADGVVPAMVDYGNRERIIALPRGCSALLCVCYDMFGVGQNAEASGTRSGLINRLIDGKRVIRRYEPGFKEMRRSAIGQWHQLLCTYRPHIAVALVHRFKRPGRDGYWQRHAIAGASAALHGAFSVAAAHFSKRLPALTEAPLAALGVGREHLSQGPHRRAWPFFPSERLPVYLSGRLAAVLRVYQVPKREL